jgi:tartrate dehydrogenase/decarboxylase/D-malate dehydrogenase
VIGEVAKEYPDVEHRYMYIDATSANFVLRPWIFDVVLTTNLFGDILSDLGGALMGSLGLGGSGNINPEKDYPSMFEPIHGSAPDIAGQNIANPFGMFWSVSLMLEHLGEKEAADAIINSCDIILSEGNLPVDLGGTKRTHELASLVASKI